MTHDTPLPLSRRSLLLTLSACGLVALLSGCGRRDAAPNSTFVLLDGSQINPADFKGQVTLVNFWSTTCASCVQKMPYLVSTYNKFKDRGFEIVAVAMSHDPPAWVLNFAQTRQLPFKVVLDNTGQIAQAWGDVRLTPTTYVVDKQGRIVSQFVGTTDFVALHQLIERLLAQS